MSIISLSNLSAVAMAAGMQFFSVIKSQSGLFASVSLNFYIDGCLIFYDHFVPCVKNPPVLLCFLTKHLFHFLFFFAHYTTEPSLHITGQRYGA